MYSVPLSNYLSSHSFISVWAHGHVFDTGGYNLMQCCHLDCLSLGHWEFFLLAPVSLCYIPIIVKFFS